MCGLFGFVNFNDSPDSYLARARSALQGLSHRGPDQSGEVVVDNVYIGHRRLSILDVTESGRQPFRSPSGDVSLTINGEIYNYLDLRSKLCGVYKFESSSDSEVALHGYRAWGLDGLVERIDGMYAISIYDQRHQTLMLVRDRVGIKPLYFAHVGGLFVWASELKAIVSFLGSSKLTIDNSALYDLLTYRYIPSPKTSYIEIRKLEAGHYLTLDVRNRKVNHRRYWHLPVNLRGGGIDHLAEQLRTTIETSVKTHLVSDVPIGAFLSGGLDSSIVTMHASKSINRMHSFSIGFDVPGYDETEFARIAASSFGVVHHERRLSRSDSSNLLAWMRTIYDEPFGDYSALPTWHVSNLARSKVTVALSGDGGDEIFGGYNWYQHISRIMTRRGPFSVFVEHLPFRIPYIKRPKSRWQSFSNRLALNGGMGLFELYVVLMNAVPFHIRQPYKTRLGLPSDYDDFWLLRRHFKPELGIRRALQYLDFHTYLPDDILTKVDRASMAVSLECRVPFLSRDVVEFAFSLPEDFLYLGGQLKGGLKYAYRHLLPGKILNRTKKGFGIPALAWQVIRDDETSFEQLVLRDFVEHNKKNSAYLLGNLDGENQI